jgi:hypothetical protein
MYARAEDPGAIAHPRVFLVPSVERPGQRAGRRLRRCDQQKWDIRLSHLCFTLDVPAPAARAVILHPPWLRRPAAEGVECPYPPITHTGVQLARQGIRVPRTHHSARVRCGPVRCGLWCHRNGRGPRGCDKRGSAHRRPLRTSAALLNSTHAPLPCTQFQVSNRADCRARMKSRCP